jgi:1,4-alpha-glucan branching enzyme
MHKFSEDQAYLFNTGADLMSYHLLGAHTRSEHDGIEGLSFRGMGPCGALRCRSQAISMPGTFMRITLDRMGNTGIFSGFVAGASKWDSYKYYITSADGRGIYKADPYRLPFGDTSRHVLEAVSSRTMASNGWTTDHHPCGGMNGWPAVRLL